MEWRKHHRHFDMPNMENAKHYQVPHNNRCMRAETQISRPKFLVFQSLHPEILPVNFTLKGFRNFKAKNVSLWAQKSTSSSLLGFWAEDAILKNLENVLTIQALQNLWIQEWIKKAF